MHVIRCVGFLLLLSLLGCASYQRQSLFLHDSLAKRQPQQALALLENQSFNRKDTVLYNLNKGLLMQMQGMHQKSNVAFEQAKQEMQVLEATSIIENVESVTIGETLRSYPGQPYEKLLLHAYMAINYLLLNKPDDARVEVMQADVKMREWASSDEIEGVKASAFVRYIAGLIFEINNESDNALIAYRKAYQAYQENAEITPLVLQRDLLRMTKRLGLKQEHQRYRKQFADHPEQALNKSLRYGELIYIYNSGLVSPVYDHTLQIFSPDFEKYIPIALPYYLPAPLTVGSEFKNIFVNQDAFKVERIESIDQLARDNLNARMPGITARALARAAIKKRAVDKANKEDSLLGFITKVAAVVTETADTRSWSVLPAGIHVAKILLPAGRYNINNQEGHQPLSIDIVAEQKTLVVGYSSSNLFNMVRL